MSHPFYRQCFLALMLLGLAACAESIPMPTPATVPTALSTQMTMPTLTPTVAPTSTPLPTTTFTPVPLPISLATRIAFVSDRDGNREIYLLNIDGSLVNLTNNPAQDSEPSWSPDGTRIAFVSNRDGNQEIYVMNIDGSGPINVTNDPATDSEPIWSPDGTRIAFLSDRDDDNDNGLADFDIHVANPDGSDAINLTKHPAFPRSFAWSPNSKWLVFWERGQDQHESELYRINVNSLNLVQLTNDSSHTPQLGWSPDGSRIAFCYGTEGPSEIHVMNFDGTGRIMLTHHSEDEFVSDYFSAWSPDSSRIAFSSDRDGSEALYIMNADGSNVIRLLDSSITYAPYSARWSPDGMQIAVDCGGICVVNVSDALQQPGGLKPVKLTEYAIYESSFVWQP